MRKTKKIIGISFIVIVILVALFGVLYLKTDMLDFLKKPKKLFFTYIMQNKEGLPEFNYLENIERMQEGVCRENGTIKWNFEANGDIDEDTKIGIDIINNANITYDLKTNTKEKKVAGNLNFEYDGERLLGIDIILNKNIFAIKIGEIYDNYIAIENDNLKELAEKIGIDSTNIPNKIEFAKTIEFDTLSEEELNNVKETYKNVLEKSINEESFTKSKETIIINGEKLKTKAYKLTLSQQEIKQLIINFLEELQKDDVLLDCFVNNVNKINMVNYGEEYEELRKAELKILLTYLISSMEQNVTNSNEKLEITVYESKGKTVRTKLGLPGANIILDRQQDGGDTKFRLSVEENKVELIAIDFDFKKGKDKNEIKASMEVQNIKMQISFKTNKEITENILELLVETEEAKVTIKDSSKLEYSQGEIDESGLEGADILNKKTAEEINDIITKIQENLNKFIEKSEL